MNVAVEIPTREGVFVASFSGRGLCRLEFPESVLSRRRFGDSTSITAEQQLWLGQTQTALVDILTGHSPRAFPPLDWAGQTEFRQSVWRAMLRIKLAETKSYGDIAIQLGKPLASRAVGGACGANPIPVLVPCHRVLAANRQIGGFSGGLGWKRRLLEIEGVCVK